MSERTAAYTERPREELQDLLARYETALSSVVAGHARAASQISMEYAAGLQQWLLTDHADDEQPAKDTLKAALDKPQAALDQSTSITATSTDQLISKAKADYESIVSGHDLSVWDEVKRLSHTYGAGSATVANAVRHASSPAARQAMQVGLDTLVWDEVKRLSHTYGAGSATVANAVRHASSPAARQAMQAALPKPEPRPEYNFFSDNYTGLRHSAQELKDLIAGLKSGQEAKGRFRQFLSQSRYEEYIHYLEAQLTRAEAQEAAQQAQEQARQHERQRQRDQSHRHRSSHQQPPRGEAKSNQNSDPEVEAVVQKITSNRQYAWIRNENRANIRRVMTTVRHMREKAEASGTSLTDRDIYLRYRRMIDKPKEEVSPQLLSSYQILDAMMGGSINGRLPF